MLPIPLSLLSVLPLALAAPTCLLRPTSAAAPSPSSSATPQPTNPGNTTTAGAGTSGQVAMAWYADWHSGYTVADISWSGYTHMSYFTGQPSSSGTIEVLSGSSTPQEFTAAAKANGVIPLLTVGGWDGSIYWSSSVATDQNRSTLANSLVQYASENGFDGLDFDWEYPGKSGVGCNIKSPDDTANFLSFLQEMRSVAPNLTLSAAVGTIPWSDSNGTPSNNVSGFADVLDFIEIMNYDVYGTFSSVTGPNSPLNDSCAATSDQQGSAVSAIATWATAGFPINKILLGVAAYGHSFNVAPSTAVNGNQLAIYTSFDKTNIPPGDAWDPTVTSPDICGNPPVGNGNTGIYNYWALIQDGLVTENGTATSSMIGYYDECSQTPFVYNPSTSTLVSYDNPQSFAAKGQFIKNSGLKGFALYEAGGDQNGTLVQAIRQAMA